MTTDPTHITKIICSFCRLRPAKAGAGACTKCLANRIEAARIAVQRGTITCPRCRYDLLVDTEGNVTQCYNCGDKAFVDWNLFYDESNPETITSLAKQVHELYGTDLTEKLLEVATSAEQRLEELSTCQLCEAAALYSYCRKHR